MVKERRILPVSSNRNRVSPYPLRSCRSKKLQEAEPPLVQETASQWEDVRCVICMEPPHNAVLLQCTSFSKGCRAYMCDTTSRHTNCYKQYRRNKSRSTSRCIKKTLSCPFCRGEVHGTVKSTCARRFMNARPRPCSVDKCGFSGTYSQLKTHLKAEHPDFTPLKLDTCEHQQQHEMWEQLEREAEYNELLDARRRWEAEQRSLSTSLHQIPHRHPVIDIDFDAFMHSILLGARRQASAANYPATHMPRMEFHVPVYPTWMP
ncbi:unnamed protein product [Cochlearia groenlandica]